MGELLADSEYKGINEPSTPVYIIDDILDLAKLNSNEVFLDPGCGEGLVVERAAKKYRARVIGIEIHRKLAIKAKQRVNNDELRDRVEIINGDCYNFNFGVADVVYLSFPTIDLELKEKLENELKYRARVVSLECPVPEWKPKKVKKVHVWTKKVEQFLPLYLYNKSSSFHSRLVDKIKRFYK